MVEELGRGKSNRENLIWTAVQWRRALADVGKEQRGDREAWSVLQL